MNEYMLYVDGGSRGNGTAEQQGYGSWALFKAGWFVPVKEYTTRFGSTTNNEAEYLAMASALAHIGTLPYGSRVVVKTDSLLLLDQLSGAAKVKAANLQPLWMDCKEELIRLQRFGYEVDLAKVSGEQMKRVLGH